MENYAFAAIQSALHGRRVFCKFLSANDTGSTGGHQAGIYISKPSIPILFSTPGERGVNKDRWVKVQWMDGSETDTRFIYYGQGSRNEYRITNFGRGFPYLRPEYTGALFVFVQNAPEDYQAYILNSDDEINQFLDAFGLSATETNRLIDIFGVQPEVHERAEIERFISSLDVDFPASEIMSDAARRIETTVYDHVEDVCQNPDKKLIDWTDTEYRLFRALEHFRYGDTIARGFSSVEDFIMTANQVLNRRKSRAGKSFEHQLAAIFQGNGLLFEEQVVTEGNKKPDFVFPSAAAYHSRAYPIEEIATLAAKTTCKDRWRQVINEADRMRDRPKFLCTLQQGISTAQLDEMAAEQVVLVVPKPYISAYPRERQDQIWTLKRFITFIDALERL